jgi:membrane protein YqaA with SNARE-associated domain
MHTLAATGSVSTGGPWAYLVVSVLATGVGGLAGYAIGLRWGRLGVLFTPCLMPGIAKMK